MLGRASTLYPRTLEILDQLDLFDDMAQQGVIVRRSITFDSNGKRANGRGWSFVDDARGTYFNYLLNLRLKYSEDIFRRYNKKLGGHVQAPVKLVDFSLDENAADDYKITATCQKQDASSFRVKAKYIVGCDGGSSAVRKLAKIPFIGEDREDFWV